MKFQNDFWVKYFEYYDILLKVIPYQELLKKIVLNLKIEPCLRLLDLGAGTGNLQYFLPSSLTIVSLDNSVEALARLSVKFPKGITVRHSIQDRLPFEDNSFDRIVSNNVLYTLKEDEWRFVVSELRRVSKPNGVIVISNLNEDFNAFNIYKDHIKKSIRINGLTKTLFQLISMIFPTIQMIRFNSHINKLNDTGHYSFLKANRQKDLFERYDMKSIKSTEEVYSKQAYLDVFVNTKAETI